MLLKLVNKSINQLINKTILMSVEDEQTLPTYYIYIYIYFFFLVTDIVDSEFYLKKRRIKCV